MYDLHRVLLHVGIRRLKSLVQEIHVSTVFQQLCCPVNVLGDLCQDQGGELVHKCVTFVDQDFGEAGDVIVGIQQEVTDVGDGYHFCQQF